MLFFQKCFDFLNNVFKFMEVNSPTITTGRMLYLCGSDVVENTVSETETETYKRCSRDRS